MRLDEAKATAIGMVSRFGADFAVFRLPGWNAGEWGVRKADEIPSTAEIAETFRYTGSVAPAPTGEDDSQGSLF